MEQDNDRATLLKRLKEERSYSAYASFGRFARQMKNTDQSQLRIAVLRNVTVEPLIPIIEGEAALLGLSADVYVGDYDVIASDVFDPESVFYRHSPDIIILFQWLEGLAPSLNDALMSLSGDAITSQIKQVIDTLETQITAIREHSDAPILINNFPRIYRPTLGILEAQLGTPGSRCLEQLNSDLMALVQSSSNVFCLDLALIYARIGASEAFDDRHWAMARIPFGKKALVPVGMEYGRFIRALNGKSRKCLVLDCDGTLWGGIVGEYGIDGIKLGPDFPGNSFVMFQKEVLNLYHRGILLAICSKNNEEDVLDVLRNHPNMILKEEHFAAMRINWSDKAENILSIADELNVGVDSLVFIDDTDFECNRVREALPDVEVMHLKDQPSSYRRQLSDAGLFDSLIYSAEDRKRTATFKAEIERQSIQKTASSLENYLMNLEIRAKIALAEGAQISRISQLTQKTNQFNLTTHRYTESDIRALCEDTSSGVLYLWFADKLSEFGIVAIAIIKIEGHKAIIDTFLMSCRALGRELEKALLSSVMTYAWDNGCTTLIGLYKKTKRNHQVADFYEKNLFQLVRDSEDKSEWCYAIANSEAPELTLPSWIKLTADF